MSFIKKIKEWLEIEEVKLKLTEGKPPAKTEAKHVPMPVSSENVTPVAPTEASAIEVKEPEPVEPPRIGEEGKRRRIKK